MSKRARGREPIIKSRAHLRKILDLKKKNNLTDVETAAHFGISVNTIYNTVNRYTKKAVKRSKRKASAKKGVKLSKQQSQASPTKTEAAQ